MNISATIWPTMCVAKATHSRRDQGYAFTPSLTVDKGRSLETGLDQFGGKQVEELSDFLKPCLRK
jgi:hypothetical protein